MPSDLKCPHCDLRVSIGGYHYHHFGTGYGGRMLMPCSACGTQHAIEFAMPSQGPEFHEVQKVVVDSFPHSALNPLVAKLRDEATPKPPLPAALAKVRHVPFTLVEAVPQARAEAIVDELSGMGVAAHRETIGRERNLLHGPQRTDRLLYREKPQHGEAQSDWLACSEPIPSDTSTLHCQACGSAGTLLEKPADDAFRCPVCKTAHMTDAGHWVT